MIKQIIEEFYKEKYGRDVTFGIMPIQVVYSYLDSNVSSSKQTVNEAFFVPFVIDKNLFSSIEKKYGRVIKIDDIFDIGTVENYSFDEVYKKINEVIPKECIKISEEEIILILKEKGKIMTHNDLITLFISMKLEEVALLEEQIQNLPYSSIKSSKVEEGKEKEEITDFERIMTDYLKKKYGEDIVFDFMHVDIRYSYVFKDKLIQQFHRNGSASIYYRDSIENISKTTFLPFVTSSKFYSDNYSEDSYYIKRRLTINKSIDLGTSESYSYDEVIKSISEAIPKECIIITEEELREIANECGYERFEWEIYDKGRDYPDWSYRFFGIKDKKLSENEAKRSK